MRRRSSDSKIWSQRSTWASILGASVAVSAALCAANFLLISPRRIEFINIRAANLTELRKFKIAGERIVTGKSPLLVISERGVVFGSMTDVLAPVAQDSFGLLPFENWKINLEKIVEKWTSDPRNKENIPMQVLLVSFEDGSKSLSSLPTMKDIVLIFGRVNKKHGFDKPPSLVMTYPNSQKQRIE